QGKSNAALLAEHNKGMPEVLDPADTKRLITGGKNKALMALHRKFDYMMQSKKALNDVSLSQLAQTFGILFDKDQILKGEATENIAVMAQVDKDMKPEDALAALGRFREAQEVEKFG